MDHGIPESIGNRPPRPCAIADGVLADNYTRNNALIRRLSTRGRIKTWTGGRTIVEELAYADNSTFQWYSGLTLAPLVA